MEKEKVLALLKDKGALTVDMSESIVRGNPEILFADESAVFMIHDSGVHLLWAKDAESALKVLKDYPTPAKACVIHGRDAYYAYLDFYKLENPDGFCLQYCYSKKELLPVPDICEMRMMTEDDITFIQKYYTLASNTEYLLSRIEAGEIWGAYRDGKCVGFIGSHREGSIGMLTVLPEYRRMGYGTALENYQMNRYIKKGWTPYGQVYLDNDASHTLQRKTGLDVSSDVICWVVPQDD